MKNPPNGTLCSKSPTRENHFQRLYVNNIYKLWLRSLIFSLSHTNLDLKNATCMVENIPRVLRAVGHILMFSLPIGFFARC